MLIEKKKRNNKKRKENMSCSRYNFVEIVMKLLQQTKIGGHPN